MRTDHHGVVRIAAPGFRDDVPGPARLHEGADVEGHPDGPGGGLGGQCLARGLGDPAGRDLPGRRVPEGAVEVAVGVVVDERPGRARRRGGGLLLREAAPAAPDQRDPAGERARGVVGGCAASGGADRGDSQLCGEARLRAAHRVGHGDHRHRLGLRGQHVEVLRTGFEEGVLELLPGDLEPGPPGLLVDVLRGLVVPLRTGHPGTAVAVGDPLQRGQGVVGGLGVAGLDQPGGQLGTPARRVRVGGGAPRTGQQ